MASESHRKEREVKVMQEMIDEKTLARVQEQLAAEKAARKKEQQRKAALKYQAKSIQRKTVILNRETDKDIIAKLEQIENMSGYIKSLIRADINK
ncbi:MAG: hypothetical protein IIV40_02550 [Oscillospiraceae bacterium]|nr:hypothetical protein [Oscillospiraceae bacterium]